MRFSTAVLGAVVLAQTVTSTSNVGKAVYNAWHKSELERWLDDHGIPYVTPADRAQLEKTVSENWDKLTSQAPFSNWQDSRIEQFSHIYVGDKRQTGNTGGLLKQLEDKWNEGWARIQSTTPDWSDVKSWVFDTWSDSQLRAFLEYHNVVTPVPTTREKLLAEARTQYDSIAKQIAGQKNSAADWVHYPGNWLYDTWSDSELRDWLVQRGFLSPGETPPAREKLLAEVRRNWIVQRVLGDTESVRKALSSASAEASNSAEKKASAVSAAAQRESASARREADKAWSAAKETAASVSAAFASAGAEAIEKWSDSDLKKWADERGIKVPQGSNRNELVALVRHHRARLLKEAESAYRAATTGAGNGLDWVWEALGLKETGRAEDSAQSARASVSRAAEAAQKSLSSIKGEL